MHVIYKKWLKQFPNVLSRETLAGPSLTWNAPKSRQQNKSKIMIVVAAV